ncbi:MAG: hypothetical protein JJU31_07600 [Wenzhouxiangella sp.]|nr:hypothetical protein [Wenzhouxiangella sp.]
MEFGSHIQNALGAAFLEQANEEIAFTGETCIPVNQFIPLLDEAMNIFSLVMVSLPDFFRLITDILRRCRRGLLYFLVDDSFSR